MVCVHRTFLFQSQICLILIDLILGIQTILIHDYNKHTYNKRKVHGISKMTDNQQILPLHKLLLV